MVWLITFGGMYIAGRCEVAVGALLEVASEMLTKPGDISSAELFIALYTTSSSTTNDQKSSPASLFYLI
jgi:hypothetical protein